MFLYCIKVRIALNVDDLISINCIPRTIRTSCHSFSTNIPGQSNTPMTVIMTCLAGVVGTKAYFAFFCTGNQNMLWFQLPVQFRVFPFITEWTETLVTNWNLHRSRTNIWFTIVPHQKIFFQSCICILEGSSTNDCMTKRLNQMVSLRQSPVKVLTLTKCCQLTTSLGEKCWLLLLLDWSW